MSFIDGLIQVAQTGVGALLIVVMLASSMATVLPFPLRWAAIAVFVGACVTFALLARRSKETG